MKSPNRCLGLHGNANARRESPAVRERASGPIETASAPKGNQRKKSDGRADATSCEGALSSAFWTLECARSRKEGATDAGMSSGHPRPSQT